MRIIAFTCFALLLNLMVSKQHDPFETLIDYETRQRESIELFEGEYNLLPFLVHKTKQVFVYEHNNDKQLNVQILAYWFDQHNQIAFPEFNLQEKIRITIEEDVYSKTPIKATATKQFLTQTGFSINVQSGKRYRWTIETFGNQKKMVEIAIGSKDVKEMKFKIQKKNHTNEIALLKSLKENLEKTQAKWAKNQKKQMDNSQISSMWAWISGAQIFSLIAFLGIQLVLFEKFSISFSVI